VCETTSTNVLAGACEACTATSGTCAGGDMCQQSSTAAKDDVCASMTVPTVGETGRWFLTILLLAGGFFALTARPRAALRG
jgi:hypothetical protein